MLCQQWMRGPAYTERIINLPMGLLGPGPMWRAPVRALGMGGHKASETCVNACRFLHCKFADEVNHSCVVH